ncbi:Spo12 [Penicillium hetheringtonii]|uniref:Spo12 n=1 Tax=Penicillium hetheringtonii TaxID=911720 RepID=A0AAD6DJR3_9EURO|nr:Spo12 [Penicillium hetheringtonii]
MDATTHAQPLADRPTNTHLANVNVNSDLKTDLKSADLSSMEHHRQMLQDKLDNGEKTTNFLCLTIRRYHESLLEEIDAGKPQSLFAKLGKKSYEQSSAEQGRTVE